jgi:hypothetical protein
VITTTGHPEPEIIAAQRRLPSVALTVGACARGACEDRLLCGLAP